MYTVEWFEDFDGDGVLDSNENIILTQTGGNPVIKVAILFMNIILKI